MAAKVGEFSERLRHIMEERGMTQSELAQLSGVSKSSISRYISGAWKGKQDTVYNLAHVLNVSEAWLMGYDVPMERQQPAQSAATSFVGTIPNLLPLPKTRKVPRLGTIACGEPILAEENIEETVSTPSKWHADFALTCKGDSMAPTIQDGDLVAIRIQPRVETGEIAAVRIGNEATLKRVYLHDDYIELRPDNHDHPSIIRRKNEMNDVHIEGKAVGLCRGL